MLFADTAVRLDTGREILRAERAGLRGGSQRERAADADRVAELPWRAGEVFLGDDVARGVPAGAIAGENQLRLDLPLFFRTGLAVRRREVLPRIEADEFAQCLVCTVRIGVFDVQHGIDRVLAHQKAKAILDPVTGEERSFVRCGLTV